MPTSSSLELAPFFGVVERNIILQPASRAVVFLDGIQSSGVAPGKFIENFFLRYGDFIRVHYPLTVGFNGAKVARQVLERIRHYKEVILVGVSLGGLLAHDVIALAKRWGLKIRFKLPLVCAPSHGRDVKIPGAKFAPFVPALPLPRIFSEKVLFKGAFPEHDEHLSDNAMHELRRHEELSRRYPFAPWIRQAAYTASHPGPDQEVLAGVERVYLHTLSDPFVATGTAYDGWDPFYCTPEVVVPVNGHANFLAYPRQWKAGLKEGFEAIGIWPLPSQV
jgi:pimeloyl-ACP methyl ester carboxylesterase